MSATRILLTGATGLIGRQLLPQLVDAGYDVHAVVNRREIPDELRSLATWHAGDLLDAAAMRAVLGEAAPSHLLHLAWPTHGVGLDDEIQRVHLRAGRELIGRFYESGGQRAVVAGTCFEYDWSEGLCSEETTPRIPITLYGRCKDALRQFTEDTARAKGRGWAWGRIFFVYGPHQERTRFVPAVIHGLLEQQPVICTEGRQVRDYLHAYDVASGLRHLLASGFCGDCNIGSGLALTLRDIALALADRLGGHSLLQFGAKPTPKGEPPVILADITRLRQLGWQPRFTLAEGLADTVAAWRDASRKSVLL